MTGVTSPAAAWSPGRDRGKPSGLTLTNSEITCNSADEGGGIYSRRPLKIDSTIISDNHANGAGGGIAMNTFGGQLSATTVLGNTAGLLGGGIWMQNTDFSQITRSLIMGNSASQTAVTGAPPAGGGIEVDTDPRFGATTVSITYSTIQGNVALGPGGGIFWQATGTLALDSSLVALNTAESGAGISTGPGPSTAAVGTVRDEHDHKRQCGRTRRRDRAQYGQHAAACGDGRQQQRDPRERDPVHRRARRLLDRERADHGEPAGEPELRAQHRQRHVPGRRLPQRP
jgi:hypothetical protein